MASTGPRGDTVIALRPEAIVRSGPARIPISLPGIRWAHVRTFVLVALPGAAYLAVGLVFALGAGIVTPDAWSRVGNAYYTLFSRDPHLAAIGFVWNPLPSLLELPILPLAMLWRPLVDHGIAANLMSAACMALAVRELWLWLRELGASRPVRIGLTLALAAHPMIVLYGSNGMSEAPFLLFLLIAGRALSEWTASGSIGRLAVTGLALALAYLARYEAVAPIAAVGVLVLWLTYRRASGTRRERAMEAIADGLIVGAPPVGAFMAWAVASWAIVGSPFATFTSVYGNTSQVQLSLEGIRASTGATPLAALSYVTQQIVGLEPLLPLIVLDVAIIALLWRDSRLIVPLAVFGSVIAFSAALFVAGDSFGWLRFSIAVIPLAVVSIGVLLAPTMAGRSLQRQAGNTPSAFQRFVRPILTTAAVALVLVALPPGVRTLFDEHLAREEAPQLQGLIAGDGAVPEAKRQFLVGGAVAQYLDDLSLPRASVVVDVAVGFPIVLRSSNPAQFVITPDRDFQRVLADPAMFHTRYLLVPNAQGYAEFDAVGRAHPGLYRDGAGMATLVAEFTGGDVYSTWRLYAVAR